MAQLDRQLSDELTEEVGVAVLAQLVQHKPVANLEKKSVKEILMMEAADLALAEDVLETFPDVIVVLAPHGLVEEAEADAVEHEGAQAVEEEDDGDGGEDGVPPPQDEEDLLVDDVLGEDAEAVVNLLPAAGADVGEVAGGDGGEDATHRVPKQQVKKERETEVVKTEVSLELT